MPEGPERDALVQRLRDEYRADVDLVKLASEMVIDAIVPADDLRREVARRFERYAGQGRGAAEEEAHGAAGVGRRSHLAA